MRPRLNPYQAAPGVMKAMMALEEQVTCTALEPSLAELVKIRASQINGCAFCVQHHILLSERLGVPVDKLHLVAVWREAPIYSARERAALAWAEALTLLPNGFGDEVYAEVQREFSETELMYLTSAIASINVWNRFGAAFRWTPPKRQIAANAATS